MIKAVIFDLDGTLANTLEDITNALNKMLIDMSFPTLNVNDILKNINFGAYELIRKSIPKEFFNNDEMILKCKKIYESYYVKDYCVKTFAYDGMTELLNELQKRNISLNVFSNKQDFLVKDIVKKLFNEIKFDIVLGQGLFPPKPSKEATEYIIKTLNFKKEEILYVGDSNVDMLTAKNSNLTSVGVSWGYRSVDILLENGANYIIEKPIEILKLI